MPIGWMTVLQSVPWGEVVSNAPKIAAGAKKLWKSVATKPQAANEDAPPARDQLHLSPEQQVLASLRSRIESLEAATAELHGQLAESSSLVAALAEQNTQLIVRVEKIRRRMFWVGGTLSAGVVLLLARVFLQA
ncbi:MAG: hypothetical protein EOO28_00865 [Comamonadaceae bacterium]|nr:MAG: hypothetical protein EOO28_00865 [Comamonadaceae bacterium]